MQKFFALCCLLLALPVVVQAQGADDDTCMYRRPALSCAAIDDAATRAMSLMAVSSARGLEVDTSRQVIAEGDRICLVTFMWRDRSERRMSIDAYWCVAQEGAYDHRREQGVSRRTINSLVQSLHQIERNPDSWELFHQTVLSSQEYYPALQRLIRTGYERDLILLLMLRRDVAFVNQNHHLLSFTTG